MIALTSLNSFAQYNQWENVHPSGPENSLGGLVYWAKFGVGDSAYLQSGLNSIYRRSSSNAPWEVLNPLLDGVPVAIDNLFFDSTNPNRILANRTSGPFPFFGGVIESTDGGNTWTTLRDGSIYSSTQLTAQSSNDSNALVAYMPVYYINETPKLAKTFDGGFSWVELEMNKSVGGPHSISSSDSNIIFGLNFQEFNKSVDGGMTWEVKDQGLGFLWYLNDFDVSDSDPDVVYGGSGAQTYIAKSTDGGETWQYTSSVADLTGPVTTVKVHPSDSESVYAGAQYGGAYHSSDGGQNWNSLGSSESLVWWTSIEISQFDDIMWSSRAGMFMQDENGELNPSNVGFSEFLMNRLVYAPSDSSYLYATSNAAGFSKWVPDSENWKLRNGAQGWSFGNFSIDHTNPERIVAAGSPARITTDAGLTWREFDGPNQPSTTKVWFDPDNAQRVIAQSDGELIETFDEGLSWSVVSSNVSFQKMWMNPSNSNQWFSQSFGVGLSHSQDGGVSWELVDETFGDMVVEPNYQAYIFLDKAGTDTIYLAAHENNGYIWRSTDFGVTWQIHSEESTGLVFPNSFAVDPLVEGRIYAVTSNGASAAYEPSQGSWVSLGTIPVDQDSIWPGAIVASPDKQGQLFVAIRGVLHEIVRDTDLDFIPDFEDNCTFTVNPNQRDSDVDTYGNACDADLNNDGIVNFLDLSLFASVFLSDDANSDFNGDGAVNFLDLPTLRDSFLSPPGPNQEGNR